LLLLGDSVPAADAVVWPRFKILPFLKPQETFVPPWGFSFAVFFCGGFRFWSPNATLKSTGISKDQSSKWQKLGAVPQGEFDAAQCGGASSRTVLGRRIVRSPF
jgi:hypothetical protein